MVSKDAYLYVIDDNDIIVFLSENWQAFAQENQAGDSCSPEKVLQKPIWQFIDGMEASHLYKILIGNVRARKQKATLPFRCDAPDKRRYLELHIAPFRHQWIEFTSLLMREEERDAVELLDSTIPRSDRFINICCICKRVNVSEGMWVDVEAAITRLELFHLQALPAISHGICPDCFRVAMADIKGKGR